MEKTFAEYAEKLLNNTILKVKDDSYRICEIEMYYCNDEHPDAYTHCDPLQLENGKFYAHRFKNKTFKSGTYKCMDIAYGDADTKTYFGILIAIDLAWSIGSFDEDEMVNWGIFGFYKITMRLKIEKYNILQEFDVQVVVVVHRSLPLCRYHN